MKKLFKFLSVSLIVMSFLFPLLTNVAYAEDVRILDIFWKGSHFRRQTMQGVQPDLLPTVGVAWTDNLQTTHEITWKNYDHNLVNQKVGTVFYVEGTYVIRRKLPNGKLFEEKRELSHEITIIENPDLKDTKPIPTADTKLLFTPMYLNDTFFFPNPIRIKWSNGKTTNEYAKWAKKNMHATAQWVGPVRATLKNGENVNVGFNKNINNIRKKVHEKYLYIAPVNINVKDLSELKLPTTIIVRETSEDSDKLESVSWNEITEEQKKIPSGIVRIEGKLNSGVKVVSSVFVERAIPITKVETKPQTNIESKPQTKIETKVVSNTENPASNTNSNSADGEVNNNNKIKPLIAILSILSVGIASIIYYLKRKSNVPIQEIEDDKEIDS